MAERNPAATTTTYAILGQLAWGDATTYELVKAMRRNLRFIWPRAESRIYEEAKRLVHAGLLTACEGTTGRRRRTVYSITPAGLHALREWLAAPPGPITLEHEPLLRVFLGGTARPEDLLATVAAVRDYAEAMLTIGRPLGQEYLDGTHPQQHEVHLRALSYDYLYRWALLNLEWAERTQREIASWADMDPGEKHARALTRIRATLALRDERSASAARPEEAAPERPDTRDR